MRKYELAVMTDASFTKSEQDGIVADIKKEIEKVGGKPDKEEVFGKKELSYRVKKQSEGLFLIFPFEAPPDKIRELEQKLRLKETVFRHLLLASEK